MNGAYLIAFLAGAAMGASVMYAVGLKLAIESTAQIIQEMIAKGKFSYLGIKYSCAPYPGIISDEK